MSAKLFLVTFKLNEGTISEFDVPKLVRANTPAAAVLYAAEDEGSIFENVGDSEIVEVSEASTDIRQGVVGLRAYDRYCVTALVEGLTVTLANEIAV